MVPELRSETRNDGAGGGTVLLAFRNWCDQAAPFPTGEPMGPNQQAPLLFVDVEQAPDIGR